MMFYQDLRLMVPESVYIPAEDSFMLADAAYPAGKVLEIGCGCGIVSIAWAKNNEVLGVDINPEAVCSARENAQYNKVKASFIESDLFSGVKRKFDVILFNPPYLPTEKSEVLQGALNLAFDGGNDGRIVIDRFLEQFQEFLKPGGVLFLVQSSLNGFEETVSKLENLGFRVEIAASSAFFFEKLFLLKVCKD